MNRRNLYLNTLHMKNAEIADLSNRIDETDRLIAKLHTEQKYALVAMIVMAITTVGALFT
jgi:hypothetical protein